MLGLLTLFVTEENCTKSSLEQQGKALETLQADVSEIKKGQNDQGVAIGRITTVLKVLEAGQNDVRENMATKADVLDMKAEQTKLKRRIENVEEHTKIPTHIKTNPLLHHISSMPDTFYCASRASHVHSQFGI